MAMQVVHCTRALSYSGEQGLKFSLNFAVQTMHSRWTSLTINKAT